MYKSVKLKQTKLEGKTAVSSPLHVYVVIEKLYAQNPLHVHTDNASFYIKQGVYFLIFSQ